MFGKDIDSNCKLITRSKAGLAVITSTDTDCRGTTQFINVQLITEGSFSALIF